MLIQRLSYLHAKFQHVIDITKLCINNISVRQVTGQREQLQRAHAAQVLHAEVAHLRAPAQEQRRQRLHRADVAHADVRYVHAPATYTPQPQFNNISKCQNRYYYLWPIRVSHSLL